MYTFLLSKENIELAKTEVIRLLELKEYTLKENILFANVDQINIKKIQRLSYTKKTFYFLFSCKIKDLEKSLQAHDWKREYQKDFCLRIHNVNVASSNKTKKTDKYGQILDEKNLAKYVWRKLVSQQIKPKVNLNKPKTGIEIIATDNDAFVTVNLWENHEDFESRKSHKNPILSPTAMHPRLAKALINILNPKKSEIVLDPFCGAGGILLEAGLMKLQCTGYDIDSKILDTAKKNLNHYKIKFKLIKKDALLIKSTQMKNVVTDLPYGQSSKKTETLHVLYAKFIRKLSGKAVIVFPDFIDHQAILKRNLNKKLKFRKITDYYVHKSLTRNIVIVENK